MWIPCKFTKHKRNPILLLRSIYLFLILLISLPITAQKLSKIDKEVLVDTSYIKDGARYLDKHTTCYYVFEDEESYTVEHYIERLQLWDTSRIYLLNKSFYVYFNEELSGSHKDVEVNIIRLRDGKINTLKGAIDSISVINYHNNYESM